MIAKNIAEVRRAVLAKLIEDHGATTLAKRLGHSGPSYLSQMIAGSRPITEKTARKIEDELSLPLGYMDTPPGAALPFAGTNHSLIAAVIRAIGDELERSGIKPAPAKFAELVAVVYEHSVPAGKIDLDYLRRLIRLVG